VEEQEQTPSKSGLNVRSSSGGGGSSSRSSSVSRGISPAERAAQQLAVQRSNVLNQQTALQSKANLVSSQLSAYNKIQNALNRGTVIKPEWREQAGLSSAFVNQAILSKRRTELQGQLSSLQKEKLVLILKLGCIILLKVILLLN